MPKTNRAKPLYQRGGFRLEWDRKRDGTLRSPYLAVFWYDVGRGRERSASTGTADIEAGKIHLDALFLEHTRGHAVCHACGRPMETARGHLLDDAIANYQLDHGDHQTSKGAIAARLAHVLEYIGTLPAPVTVDQVDDGWVARFRKWSAAQPIVSPKGKTRPRSLSTIEASVAQLSAAINHAFRRGDTLGPARFKSQPIHELNQTPQHRAPVKQLAQMFAYCVSPKADSEEQRERRVKERAALHRFLIVSVATLARPDAAHDVSLEPKRRQWNAEARILALNPAGRRQTKKYRATVRVPWQVGHLFDQAAKSSFYVGPKSVRKAWESMASELGLPDEGEAGMKLIRRSVAHLLRKRLKSEAWDEITMQMGHSKFDTVTDLYAPFQPDYLARVLPAIEEIIDEIEAKASGAFALPDGVVMLRRNTGVTPERRPLGPVA